MGEYTIGEHRYPRLDHTEYQRIIYEPGKVARIRMNRPRYQNALSHPHLAEIEDAFNRAAADQECKVIVLSGEGSCFSSGDDVIGLTPESPPVMADARSPEQLMKDFGSEKAVWRSFQDEHFDLLHGMHVRLQQIMKPTIAMVHRWCIYNSFGMAASMDLIFASEDALFMPAGPRVWEFGQRKALEIAYEHRFLTARECQEAGLVSRVYADFETLERETLAYADRVADQPAHRHRATKQGVRYLMNLQGYAASLDESIFRGLAYGGGVALPIRDIDEGDEHRERYEGRGMARTPVALKHLKAKLEGEGQEVPGNIQRALDRAAARDDRGAWDKALTQEWREPERIERAKADSKKYEDAMATKQEKKSGEQQEEEAMADRQASEGKGKQK